MTHVSSQSALGAIFDAHGNTVRAWIRDHGAPARTDDGYCLRDWVSWFIQWKLEAADVSDDDPSDHAAALRKVRLDYERHRARKMRTTADLLEGKVVRRDRVETMLGTRAAVFRADLERMARELAPKVVEFSDWRAVERAILDRLYEILRSYTVAIPADLTAVDIEALEDDDDPPESTPPTTKPKKRARRKTRGKGTRRAK